MQLLSSALCINLQRKNKITIRLPTINFIDPASITSWVEARTLVLDLGSRFTIRVQYYMSIFISVTAIGILYGLATGAGYINWKYLSIKQWICAGSEVFVLSCLCLMTMWSYSYVNEQSRTQLKRLVMLQRFLQRLVTDDLILSSNSKEIRQQI